MSLLEDAIEERRKLIVSILHQHNLLIGASKTKEEDQYWQVIRTYRMYAAGADRPIRGWVKKSKQCRVLTWTGFRKRTKYFWARVILQPDINSRFMEENCKVLDDGSITLTEDEYIIAKLNGTLDEITQR
jgi:hypothetical protein